MRTTLGLAMLALATGGLQARQVDIREWQVPWEGTRPRDPFVLDEGRVWFVGQAGHYVGYFDRATETFGRFDLADGAGPHNLILDRNGYIWYAGNRQAHIGLMNPETGAITRIEMPDSAARDPHTLTFDRDGDIWFTVQFGNFVGHLDTESHDVSLIPAPPGRTRPYGIKMDSRDRPWVVLFGTNRIAMVNEEDMSLEVHDLPDEESRPRRIGITSDDRVWYTDYSRGYLGMFDPGSGEFREWENPGGRQSLPYGMAVDDRDRVWFVETGLRPNQFVGFDPATERFFSRTEVPSGGGSIRHMMFFPPTREIWFGTDTNYVGRVVVPD